ncbi:MAG: hypothetical protein WD928_16470 [Gammaproteobacteria bacterium]
MTRLAILLAPVLILLSVATFVTVSAQAQDIDLDQIFRCSASEDAGKANCSEARDLILNNCTVCHSFVPIVMQQFDSEGWTGLLERHVGGGRVNQLSPEQVQSIHDYLTANFNGELPPPELPPALLSTWTSY